MKAGRFRPPDFARWGAGTLESEGQRTEGDLANLATGGVTVMVAAVG
jgi:hypothetical protein